MKQKKEINNNEIVDKIDYADFCRYFGNDKNFYMNLKDFVHENEISWEEFSNIRYGNLSDSYITVPNTEKVNIGKNLVALVVTNSLYRKDSLADLFCSVYNEGMDEIVGVLFVRNTLRQNIESWVVVKQFDESNKYDDISIAKFLKKYNIAADDMNIEVVNLSNGIDCLNYFSLRNGKMFYILNFYGFSEYRNHRLSLIKNHEQEVRKRRYVRKKYESQLESMSIEEFNKLYNSLNLSYKGVKRKEYLKFYMYHGDNLKKYVLFSLLNKKNAQICGPIVLSGHRVDLER